MDTDEPEAPKRDGEDVCDRAIRQIDSCICFQQDVRSLALQARRFAAIPGAQWEGEWGEQFGNSIRVEINKTALGLKKIKTDYLANRIIPTFRNVGSDADEHTAQTIGGMHRADSYRFKAQQARDNAFSEASAGGFGAYRLSEEYDDPEDKDNDDLRINPGLLIADADQCVYFDPNSQLYDKSDARWVAVLIAMSREAFETDYPDASYASMPTVVWKPYYEWYRPDQITICEYYEKVRTSSVLYIFKHKITGDEQRWWDDDLEPGQIADMRAQGYTYQKQNRKRGRVKKWVLSAAEVLEEGVFIAGCELPIVPVYGNREYIDGKERFVGHVQQAMDAQRVYNAEVSKLMEQAALAPREVPIFLDEQMPPNLAELWARQNIDRHPYALVKAVRNETTGDIVASGPIGKVEAPQLSPVMAALLQQSSSDIIQLTNGDDGADEVRANTSAEAMDIAATRIDAKSGIYIDNMRQSVQREGEIYLSKARDVYCRKGRVVETQAEDGEDGEETLQEPYTDPTTGVYGMRNDLTKGRYKCISDVTEATSTLRDRTVRRMIELATAAVAAQDMQLASACLATATANMDGEGINDLQAWNRKRMLQIGLATPNDQEKQEMAEQAQANAEKPDPQAQAVQAQADALAADAALKLAQKDKAEADTQQSKAKIVLTLAQAEAVGGPEKVPPVPTGLKDAPTALDEQQQAAEIAHTHAQTRQIHHQIDNPEPSGA